MVFTPQNPPQHTTPPRPGYTKAPAQHPPRKRGARPTPRERKEAAKPFRPHGQGVPQTWYWIPQHLSMWLNDQYGVCVTTEEAFAKACCGIFIQDKEVGRWARSHNVLEGAMLDEVLDWMASKGFEQDGNTYNDGAKESVDFTNHATLCAAILRGPVKIGIAANALEGVVGSHNGWFLTNARRDQNIDHSVTLCAFGKISDLARALNVTVPSGVDGNLDGYMMFTWDTIGIIDRQSMINITGEAWVRNPTTVQIGTNPPTPDTVDTPTPTPPPPPPPPTPPPPPPITVKVGRDLSPGGYQVSPTDQPMPPEPGAADLVLSAEMAPGTYIFCPYGPSRAHLGGIPFMYYLELAMWAWAVVQAILSGAPIPPPPAPPAHV